MANCVTCGRPVNWTDVGYVHTENNSAVWPWDAETEIVEHPALVHPPEKRLDQIEKDIEEITVILHELLTWKRNEATRNLPTTQPQPPRKDP